eukprot:4977994-Amphidinium_carterae.1
MTSLPVEETSFTFTVTSTLSAVENCSTRSKVLVQCYTEFQRNTHGSLVSGDAHRFHCNA